jgi:uncharacterized protein (TIGR02757 family)
MSVARRALPVLAPDHLARLERALEEIRASCDAEARRRVDPVSFVHEHAGAENQELAGLLASTFAFGNVTTIRAKLAEVRERLGSDLAAFAEEPARMRQELRGFRHRLYTGDDVAALLTGARAVQRRHGSLGAAFASRFHGSDLASALAAFVDAVRADAGFSVARDRRGPAHMLPDPRSGSASKRLLLFMRWMVRPADGVDLGLWPVSPSALLVPVDVHVHKLASNLGLTTSASPSWRVAEEITSVFRLFDRDDPVKYDFALCHLGMASGCASRFVREVCTSCPIRGECLHGSGPRRRGSTGRPVRAKVPARR